MPRILSLSDPANASLETSARAIYEQAFEPEEKVPFEGLWQSARKVQAEIGIHFWGLAVEDNLLGTAWFCTFPKERLGYLGYIAISSAGRGQGYGEILMKAVLAQVDDLFQRETGQPPLATFWEVRDPEEATDEAERNLRLRRIRFYQKFGAQTLPVAYRCPPVAAGQPEVDFKLMAVTSPAGGPLDRALMKQIALAGLVKMEGADPQSVYVQRALASIESA